MIPPLLAALFSATCSRPLDTIAPAPSAVIPTVAVQPRPNPEIVLVGIGDPSAWWTLFGDPGLNAAVTLALTYNRELAAAAARIGAAEAQGRIAGAAELPRMDVGFNQGRQRANYIGLPIPGRENSVLTTTNSYVGLSLNLSWEPDFWGKVRSGKIAAAADIEGERANLAAARLSLAGQTAKAWFAAVDAKRQVGVARASLENYRVSVESARGRREAGVRSSLDLEMALAELSRAEARLDGRRQQSDSARRQLEILMGIYPGGDHEVAEDLPDAPPDPPAGLASEAVHRRPDLLAAERTILAADARIAESRAELRPRFSLTGAGGTITNTLRQVLSGDVAVWSLAGGLTQPLFDRGRLKAAVQQREAEAQLAAARYETAVLRAYGEAEVAIASDHYLAGQERALEEATRRALTAQTLAEEQYRGGLVEIATLLTAQRAALEAESAWLNARRARLDNRIDLHLALGGDFVVRDGAAAAPIGATERGQ